MKKKIKRGPVCHHCKAKTWDRVALRTLPSAKTKITAKQIAEVEAAGKMKISEKRKMQARHKRESKVLLCPDCVKKIRKELMAHGFSFFDNGMDEMMQLAIAINAANKKGVK